MKFLALVTYTDCENKWRSIEAAGHEVVVEQYDNRPHDRHRELCDLARTHDPNYIVLIGAVEHYHGRPCPQHDVLLELQSIAPSILMCNDAGDPPWWPTLDGYMRDNCFSLIVSIDGRLDIPLASYDRALFQLTPIDSRPFESFRVLWDAKPTKFGMIGGIGHADRSNSIQYLRDNAGLEFTEGSSGPGGRPYNEMASIVSQMKCMFVHPGTGSGMAKHVKGRVIEAGFGGCVVLDHIESPTEDWFESGTEFIQYKDPEHAAWLVNNTPDEKLREIASRFRERVISEHHPKTFWDDVIYTIEGGDQ